MPTLVVYLSHRGRPKLRLQLVEPLQSDRAGSNQAPMEADKDPPQARVEGHPLQARAESLPPLARVGSHPLPPKAVNRPLQVEVGHQLPWETLSTLPQVGEEWVIVPGPTGTK